MGLSASVLALVLVSACGDDVTPAPEDAAARDAPDGSAAAFAPTPPAPPLLSPCPAGHRVVTTEGGLALCEPWPEGGASACAAGEAHFPGEPGCARLGAECPSGTFPALPADAVALFVSAGATAGDGSLGAPFGSIRDAARVAAPGTTIAVSRGRFVEEVSLGSDVALRGACVEETTLTSESAVARVGALTVTGRGVLVRDLAVSGSSRRGVQVREGASADLEGLLLEGNDGVGLVALPGSALTGRRLAVRGTLTRSGDPATGIVVDGADVQLSRVVVEGTVGSGVSALGGSLALSDSVIRDQVPAAGLYGRGLNAVEGATVELSGVVLEDNRDNGVFVAEAASVTASDVIVRRTGERASDLTHGRGFMIQDGSTVMLRRVLLDENRESQLIAITEGTRVRAEDLVIRRSRPRASDMAYGRGTDVEYGADLEIVRGLIEQVYDVGIFSNEAGTALTLQDVTIRDVAVRQSNLTRGRGVEVQLGAQARMTRVAIERTQELGLFVADLSSLVLRDCSIRDVAGRSAEYGRGVAIQQRVDADVDGLLVEGTQEIGVYVQGFPAVATLRRVVVRDTRSLPCASTTCADRAFGMGLGIYSDSRVELTDFEIAGADLCGLHVAGTGPVGIHEGLVRDSTIGACVQAAGFDLAALAATVRFSGNETNLDTATLPVPDPVAEI